MRIINDIFIKDLKLGILAPFLERVQEDKTLCLEIREDYVNIYYRGCNIAEIKQSSDNQSYTYSFNTKYFKQDVISLPSNKISGTTETANAVDWVDSFPILKNAIDLSPKGGEREFQQLVVRENNDYEIGNSTDYFICDIEYALGKAKGRFDLIAIKWLSDGTSRQQGQNLELAFIEKKYGDGAITGKSGIKKHIKDFAQYINDESAQIHDEMTQLFNIKIELGLITGCSKKIESIQKINSKNKPEVILLLANHDPGKSGLSKILNELKSSEEYKDFCKVAKLKFSVSSFMGYGLFEEGIYDLDSFQSHFKSILG